MKKLLHIFFCLMLLASGNSNGQNADINILHAINSDRSANADIAFKLISNSVAPISLAAPITMFVTGLATHDKELQRKSYVAGASFVLASAVSYTLKITIKRPRPYDTYPDLIVNKTEESSYSFPSGHTTAAFATATSLSLAFPKWYVIVPSYAYACAAGYSRMYLGVHYPSDVLGGMLIGIGTAYLVYKAEKWMNKK